MLEIRNLHASVEGKEILRGINLTIRDGEVHVLVNGRVVKEGTADLGYEIEKRGFDWIKEELAQ